MSEGVAYADLIILALIAGFILLRLRSVLGQKNGDETDFMAKMKPMADIAEPVVQVSDRSLKKPKEETDDYLNTLKDSHIIAAMAAIKAKDPQFSAGWFLNGAHHAFEMVFEAFNKGDKQTLQMLLSDTMYQQFLEEIEAREKQDNKTESTLVSIESKDIAAAAVKGSMAQVTVKFVSEQIHVVRSRQGEIVEGNPSQLSRVEDEWVFERDLGSKNPNWKIIET